MEMDEGMDREQMSVSGHGIRSRASSVPYIKGVESSRDKDQVG